MDTYNTCPKSFFLQYIECKERSESSFGQYGSFCHSVFEKYAKGELEAYELLDEYAEKFDEMVTEPFPPNKHVDLREKYYNQGHDCFSDFGGFDDYEILAVEKRVSFLLWNTFPFTGVIDLVVRDKDGNLIIIDHKSKAIFKRKCLCEKCGKSYSMEFAEKKNFQCTKKCGGSLVEDKKEAKEYLRQLYIYSIPVLEEYGEYPKKLVFNFFREGGFWETDFELESLHEAENWVLQTIDLIRSDDSFAPKKSDFFCDFICGVRQHCTDSNSYLGIG